MPGELVPDRRDLRASHEDRDQVVERLTVAAGDGRLTAEELDERIEAALTSRTYGELAALLVDLPEAGPAWGAGVAAAARSGSVLLDLTQAVVSAPALEIEVAVSSGSVTLLVPPDVVADVDDVEVRSGSVREQARPAPATPVRLRIQVTGEVRDGSITTRPPRPPRRGFWQWLLRRPGPAAALPH